MAMTIHTGAGPVAVAIDIYTNGHVHIDGKDTGLGVTQRASGTALFRREDRVGGYLEVELPHRRYSLVHPAPLSGLPGLAQFEADVRAVVAAHSEEAAHRKHV